MLSRVKDATEQDVLPPEGEEEGGVTFIDLASGLGRVVGGGEARGDVGDRGAVGRESVELRTAGLLDLGDVPMGRARRTQGHNGGDGGPEVVDGGAPKLVLTAESLHEGRPLALHGAKMGLPGNLLVEGGGAGRSRASRAGQGTAALEGFEVLTLSQGEEGLVAEGRRGGVVQ